MWDAYDQTAYAVVYEQVQNVPLAAATTLWLETPAGQQWVTGQDHENGAEPAPYHADDVVLDVLGCTAWPPTVTTHASRLLGTALRPITPRVNLARARQVLSGA